MKNYYCTETETIYTVDELKELHAELVSDGSETFFTEFEDWLTHCMYENNGSLKAI